MKISSLSPLSLLKLRGLTEVFGRCAATNEFEPNSGFEEHEDLLPFPLSLRERAGVRGKSQARLND
jgi:hypothetical protein